MIDLDRYRSAESRVFTGRERGRLVRVSSELDRLDKSAGGVLVRVPNDTYGIASSFFLGMFGESIRRLGASEFRQKYHFEGPNVDVIVDDGIREAEKMHSPLE